MVFALLSLERSGDDDTSVENNLRIVDQCLPLTRAHVQAADTSEEDVDDDVIDVDDSDADEVLPVKKSRKAPAAVLLDDSEEDDAMAASVSASVTAPARRALPMSLVRPPSSFGILSLADLCTPRHHSTAFNVTRSLLSRPCARHDAALPLYTAST